MIKRSQEEAKKLLAENEEKAKREIDLIVAIKKDFDDLAAKGKKQTQKKEATEEPKKVEKEKETKKEEK